MAIQPHQLNYFPPQIIPNSEIMNNVEEKVNIYNPQVDFGLPLSGITTESHLLLPFYNNNNNCNFVDFVPHTFDTMKAESGVTINTPSSLPKKRSRDSFMDNQSRKRNNSVSFLGEDISFQIQQQQLEMNQLITQHMDRVRLMLLERRKEHSRRLITSIGAKLAKKLKEKEEEIEKIANLNWVLEERVNTLFLENQMWRNLAETNEATAMALRTNLEQILSHHREVAVAEDAESCCGSSDEGAGKEGNKSCGTSRSRGSGCRKCGKEESSVVLMPCRHLCLCTFCAPSVHKCPVCQSNKNGSVHVNMS